MLARAGSSIILLDLVFHAAEQRHEGLKPSARNSHTATLVGGEDGAGRMVVIGGGSSSGLLLSVRPKFLDGES